MIDKLEAGKTYRLIGKEGYLNNYGRNKDYYNIYFKMDKVEIEELSYYGNGKINDLVIISKDEFEFFELVDGNDTTHLQTINSPFGELDKQTKKDLLCAWVDGAILEVLVKDEWVDVRYLSLGIILRAEDITYRVKPTISAKEDANAIAKAKLISEAQQQLRDAQEALDKAQQL